MCLHSVAFEITFVVIQVRDTERKRNFNRTKSRLHNTVSTELSQLTIASKKNIRVPTPRCVLSLTPVTRKSVTMADAGADDSPNCNFVQGTRGTVVQVSEVLMQFFSGIDVGLTRF